MLSASGAAPPLTDLSGLHAAAASSGALVVAWGRNDWGQLGVGLGETSDERQRGRADGHQLAPQIVPALRGRPVADLSCGELFCLALVAGDGVYGWGWAEQGQLGSVAAARTGHHMVPTPTLLPFSHHKSIARVAAGSFHALALRHEGIVLSWGSNERGQLGWGGAAPMARVAGQAEVPQMCTQIAAGGEHSLALDVDGAVWAWGTNEHGELGGEGGVRGRPLRVPLGSGRALHVAAGRSFSLALVRPARAAAALEVWSWGSNESAQLSLRRADGGAGGGGAATAPRPLPLPAAAAAALASGPPPPAADNGASNASAAAAAAAAAAWVACGPAQGMLVPAAADAPPLVWGDGRDGLLGGGARVARAEPRPLGALPGGLRAVSFGATHAAAVGAAGELYAWGAPRLLADEAATQPWPEPRLVREASRLYNLTTVSCGSTHCVALGRCNERIDLCGVCGGDDSTCFLGDREVAQALQMSAALESRAS